MLFFILSFLMQAAAAQQGGSARNGPLLKAPANADQACGKAAGTPENRAESAPGGKPAGLGSSRLASRERASGEQWNLGPTVCRRNQMSYRSPREAAPEKGPSAV